MFVLRLKFPSLTQLTISGSPGLQHSPEIFSAGNNIISAEIQGIPRAEIREIPRAEIREIPRAEIQEIPRGNTMDPSLEMFNNLHFQFLNIWRSPTCSFLVPLHSLWTRPN